MILSDSSFCHAPLIHGGRLIEAANKNKSNINQWQDLSTGISPWTWPVPDEIPKFIWRSLPNDKPLREAASVYYRCPETLCFPVAGSQIAIRTIPQMLSMGVVAIPDIGYQEHRLSWQMAGHVIVVYKGFAELQGLVDEGQVDYVVVISPNNPTASIASDDQVHRLVKALRQIKGPNSLLVLDEAFADSKRDDISPPSSMPSLSASVDNLVVLRSLGKFFGLAGLRVGFVIGRHQVVGQLETFLSPWQLSSPAVYLACLALQDTHWQAIQRERVWHASEKLSMLCDKRFPACSVKASGLFVAVFGPSKVLSNAMGEAERAQILLRYHRYADDQAWLRLGLAADDFKRLEQHWQMVP